MVLKRFLLLLTLVPFALHAQTITVKQEDSRIEGRSATGYQVALDAAEDEVRNSLHKYLKAVGKTKMSGDYMTVAEPLIAGKKYSLTLYATTIAAGGNTIAWLGMGSENGEESRRSSDLEKLAYQFGVTFHREKIQAQIDESLRALQAVEKQQGRLSNQNKDLNNRIESNKREKIQLEKSLVDNKLELQDLTKKLEANSKAQDSVAIATDQIRKVVEMHRERQRSVN